MNDSNHLEDSLTPLIDDSPQTRRAIASARTAIAERPHADLTQVRPMSVLAIPRPGVDLVPDGWCADVVEPWADAQTATIELQHAKAQVVALIAAYKTLQSDTLELTKAQRYLEVRWGELLGPGKEGRPPKETSPASDDLHRMERHRLRQLAAQAETVAARIREATDVDELSRAALLRTGPHVSHNSGENEWYTPAPIIEAARQVMGGIDLDPASTETANGVVGAAAYFTVEDDGLSRDWWGNVWLNPPYAQPWMTRFAEKLVTEYDNGRISQACVLVNNATETGWWQTMGQSASAVCFPAGRVKFWHPDRISSAPLQGQAILYYGSSTLAFRALFSTFGIVMPPHGGGPQRNDHNMNDYDLEHLLTADQHDSPQTRRAIATARRSFADQLADVAITLEPDDPRRAPLLATAQAWHQRTTERSEPAEADPFAWAVDLLLAEGLIEP